MSGIAEQVEDEIKASVKLIRDKARKSAREQFRDLRLKAIDSADAGKPYTYTGKEHALLVESINHLLFGLQELRELRHAERKETNELFGLVLKRIKAAERSSKGMKYLGVWSEGKGYEVGDVATFSGCMWHCNEATTSKPGESATAWTMCVKRGRDAR